jgi:hypothetical protein
MACGRDVTAIKRPSQAYRHFLSCFINEHFKTNYSSSRLSIHDDFIYYYQAREIPVSSEQRLGMLSSHKLAAV